VSFLAAAEPPSLPDPLFPAKNEAMAVNVDSDSSLSGAEWPVQVSEKRRSV